MDSMRVITSAERRMLAPLFADHIHLRPFVDAVLQGYGGIAVANFGIDLQVAQLSLGGVTFLGGDPTHPMAGHLVQQLSGEQIIIVTSEVWRTLVDRVHSSRITPKPRVAFSTQYLELAHLHRLMEDIPIGYQITRINLELAQRIGEEVSPGLILPDIFASPADFVEYGIGFCTIADERIVCGATSSARCDTAIEIQINTAETFRRQGLARAVGAALIAYCLENGLNPDWDTDADNLRSQRLAQKLGYVPEGNYDWLVLRR